MLLRNKVALITGASTGIGAAAARFFAAEGASVVLAARSEDKIQALAEERPKPRCGCCRTGRRS